MNDQTKTVTLIHGYRDPESGDVWKDAVVRCPIFDDEIKAQEACGQSVAQSLFTLHFVRQCTVSFGPMVKSPPSHVLRRLHRDDLAAMLGAIYDLEMAPSGSDEEGNEDGQDETSPESIEQG